MNIRRIAIQSLSVGLAAVLLWVVLWSIAFPDVWTGYDAHIVRVFLLSSIAYAIVTFFTQR